MSYSRDLTYSYEERQPFFINNSVGVSVRRAIGRRFDVLVSADRHATLRDLLRTLLARDDARSARTSPGTTPAAFGYRIGQRPHRLRRVLLAARLADPKSFRDYDNLRFGTTVTYGF